MNFRRAVSVDGWSATVIGLFLMLYGPVAIPSLGAFVHQNFGSYSLIRLAGAGFFLLGTLLLAIKEIADVGIQRRISLAMIFAHTMVALIVWSQQIAIWNSPAGATMSAWLTLVPVVFGVVLIRQRRLVGARA
jgi:hypothetical protein